MMKETTKKIKAGIIGATGYAGTELVRILSAHPSVQLASLSSVSYGGKDFSEIHPSFRGEVDLKLEEGPDQMLAHCDVVFASLPHGLSEETAAAAAAKGIPFIDLGADFRLNDEEEYKEWYGCEFGDADLHAKAVYGLCEVNREAIKKTGLIANPGCYPTSIALALYPVLKRGLIDLSGIIIDAKSGVSGAGRALSQTTHFPDCNEAFSAYKAGAHRHLPEIEQTLSQIAERQISVTFTPHLLPVNRGILSTIYCEKAAELSVIRRCFEEAYAKEPFVVVLRDGEYANIKNVRMTNCCHISIHEDAHTNRLILCSAIDNMVKGAAGQAVQNMNLLFGLDETTGLCRIAPVI